MNSNNYFTKMGKWILVPLIFLSINGFSQSISMDFPAFAGKTYDFIIFQGSRQEKVQQDTIPENGKFTLKIPPEFAPYTGMCRWLITNSKEGGGLDMAIPGHDFSIRCLSDQPSESNIVFHGFDPLNELDRLYREQQVIIDKFEAMSKATQLYDKENPLYSVFQKEKDLQVRAYNNFHEELKNSPSFNARFLPISNLIRGVPPLLTDNYDERVRLVNEFITQQMSIEDLYVSGHWENIIQSWVMLQINEIDKEQQFTQDFKRLSDRIQNPNHYTDFVGKVTYHLTVYGKDDYIDAIAPTVLESGKVKEFLGSMQVYLKAMTGTQAPDLVITDPIGTPENQNHGSTVLKSSDLIRDGFTKTLLVFYQSGCGPCENLMPQLVGNYPILEEKGVRLISISADTDYQVFENTANGHPWEDKYCNERGFAGPNFKRYGVVGTPTMFLLDKQGQILLRTADLTEVLTKL
jgi:thiol-disulfide isomerase/thioredoxin